MREFKILVQLGAVSFKHVIEKHAEETSVDPLTLVQESLLLPSGPFSL